MLNVCRALPPGPGLGAGGGQPSARHQVTRPPASPPPLLHACIGMHAVAAVCRRSLGLTTAVEPVNSCHPPTRIACFPLPLPTGGQPAPGGANHQP